MSFLGAAERTEANINKEEKDAVIFFILVNLGYGRKCKNNPIIEKLLINKFEKRNSANKLL